MGTDREFQYQTFDYDKSETGYLGRPRCPSYGGGGEGGYLVPDRARAWGALI